MSTAPKVLLPSLLVTALLLSGCSKTENEEGFQAQTQTRPKTAQVKVASEPESSVLATSHSSLSPEQGVNKTVASPEKTGPQTVMYLEPGVDRIWQNGPSPEERNRVNKFRPREPRKGVEDGFSSPVLDTTGLVLINE